MVIPHNPGQWEASPHFHTPSDAPNGAHGQFNDRQRTHSLRSTQSVHGVQSIDPEPLAVPWETEIQYKATNKNEEALRPQKRARYLVEAERTEAGASPTEVSESAKMREAAIQKKIAEAKRQKAEAQKRKIEAEKRKAEAQRNGEEARRREPEARQKEQMAKRKEEVARRRREEALRKEVDARRREDDAQRRLDDAVQGEVLAREAEARRLEEVRTKEKERKSRPAKEKVTDHALGVSRYEHDDVAREADNATRLEPPKADAAYRFVGFESVTPQREDWALEERRRKQLEEQEPFVKQDWRREENIRLEEKEKETNRLRKDREQRRIFNEQPQQRDRAPPLPRWQQIKMHGQHANLTNERKEFRPKVAEHSGLGRTTEHGVGPQNNTSAPLRFGTPAPHPPAGPTSALAGYHAGVLPKPTFVNTRQPPMPTYKYTSAPTGKSEEGWVNVESGTDEPEGVSLEGSRSEEPLENGRQAENWNPKLVPDSKKRSTDGAKPPGKSQNAGTATILGRKLSRRPFQFLKKGP